MSTVIDIADAVAATINGAEAETFASEFVATRRIVPEFEVRELETLTVSVVPKQVVISTVTRSMTQYEVPIDIGVQKKLVSQADYESEVVSLCGIVESIADYMHNKTLTGMPGVRWVSTAIDPIYSPAQIAQQRVFTSVITLTYSSQADAEHCVIDSQTPPKFRRLTNCITKAGVFALFCDDCDLTDTNGIEYARNCVVRSNGTNGMGIFENCVFQTATSANSMSQCATIDALESNGEPLFPNESEPIQIAAYTPEVVQQELINHTAELLTTSSPTTYRTIGPVAPRIPIELLRKPGFTRRMCAAPADFA